tara:strand:- start:5077 stop:5685 length:609 start_codon:yes stop_codon:yes gene_type:complete
MKILIVENEPNYRKFLAKSLLKLGYFIDVSTDGVDCLEKYKYNNYEVILINCSLPIKTGFDVCKEIRRSEINTDEHVNIVFFTDDPENFSMLEGISYGADDYINKKDLEPLILDSKLKIIKKQVNRINKYKKKIYQNNEDYALVLKEMLGICGWCDEISLNTKNLKELKRDFRDRLESVGFSHGICSCCKDKFNKSKEEKNG